MGLLRRHGGKLYLIHLIGLAGTFIFFIVLYIISYILALLFGLSSFLLIDYTESFSSGTIITGFVLLYLVFGFLTSIIMSFYLGGIYKPTAQVVFENKTSISEFFTQGFRYWGKNIVFYILTMLLTTIFIFIMAFLYGLFLETSVVYLLDFLGFIAYLIFASCLIFAPILIVQENMSGFRALTNSFRIFFRAPLSALVTLIVSAIIALISYGILILGILLIAFLFGLNILQTLDPFTAISSSIGAISAILLVVLFYCAVPLPLTLTIILLYQTKRYRDVLRPKLFGTTGNGSYTPPTNPSGNNGPGPNYYGGYPISGSSQPNFTFGLDGGNSGGQNSSGANTLDSPNTPNNYQFGTPNTATSQNAHPTSVEPKKSDSNPSSGFTFGTPKSGNDSENGDNVSSTSSSPSADDQNFKFHDQNDYTNFGSDKTNMW